MMPELAQTEWQSIAIEPYGVTLHLPSTWEALPPVPANGPEILRATGSPTEYVIVIKTASNGRTVEGFATTAQDRLAAHGYEDFTMTSLSFAGQQGVVLEFVKKGADGAIERRMREYFALKGPAAVVLCAGSATWEEHLPLIEEIASRFELS
jgi:hypothetical protein